MAGPGFSDQLGWDAVRGVLGAAELARLRAVMGGGRVCSLHPAHSFEKADPRGRVCPCEGGGANRVYYDRAEQRRTVADDKLTGLTAAQREGLLGALVAALAAVAEEKGGAR